MTRQTVKNRINSILGKTAQGFYHDEYWRGVEDVWRVLDDFSPYVTGCRYDGPQGRPIRKTWTFEVPFGNKPFYGVVVAAGAGSVEDPLSRYDIVAYVS